ncbi:MAG: hypothetical protein E6I69_04125 [Chloroflexi bacterium]|nr:MAG: hypothetical protein E6I69_04125 [Chloroflexota bacterium]
MDARLASSQRRDRSVRDHESSRDGRQQVTPGAPVLFVVNPASAAGKAGRQWAQVETWLPSAGIPYETAITTRPNEATDITQRAVRESRPVVVAVGGDGTLNEVVNGFFHNGAPIPTTSKLAMVPLGTGGDFRRTLRIPIDPQEAIGVLRTGVARRLDAGCVTYQAADGSTAVGFKNKPMTVGIDNITHQLPKAQQVVIANCQFFGGGMQMAPTASPTDGVFDVIFIKNAGKIETMRGMNDFRAGKHLDQTNPKIELLYGKRVSVTSPVKVRIDVDGEAVGFLPALFEIQPGSIEFITPR